MTNMIRRALHAGVSLAVAVSLAGCNREAAPSENQSELSLFNGFGPAGWSLTGNQPTWPQGADLPAGPLPAASPMTRSGHGPYRFAPAYDYDPYNEDYFDDSDVYYDDSPDPESYAWLSFASLLFDTLAASPPDYYFDYEGVEPWVWETNNDYVLYAEPIPVGYRYYYYAAGSDWPFFVRDPYYSYGYRENRLVVIYDASGRILDGDRAPLQRQAANLYYVRGEALRDAYDGARRYGVPAALWASRESIVRRDLNSWQDSRARTAGWRDWDQKLAPRVASRWAAEGAARQYAGRRFAEWEKSRFSGPAPDFYAEARRDRIVQRAALQQRVDDSPRRLVQDRTRHRMTEGQRYPNREGSQPDGRARAAERYVRGAEFGPPESHARVLQQQATRGPMRPRAEQLSTAHARPPRQQVVRGRGQDQGQAISSRARGLQQNDVTAQRGRGRQAVVSPERFRHKAQPIARERARAGSRSDASGRVRAQQQSRAYRPGPAPGERMARARAQAMRQPIVRERLVPRSESMSRAPVRAMQQPVVRERSLPRRESMSRAPVRTMQQPVVRERGVPRSESMSRAPARTMQQAPRGERRQVQRAALSNPAMQTARAGPVNQVNRRETAGVNRPQRVERARQQPLDRGGGRGGHQR